MKHFSKYLLILFTPLLMSMFFLTPVHAEDKQAGNPQATLTVKVTIEQPELFWSYSFLTKDADLGKPTVVKLTWGTGNAIRQEKTDTIVTAGKKGGQLSITADKDSLINLQIFVCDANNMKYGSMSFQVRNNGQTQDITVAPPAFSEPLINLGKPI